MNIPYSLSACINTYLLAEQETRLVYTKLMLFKACLLWSAHDKSEACQKQDMYQPKCLHMQGHARQIKDCRCWLMGALALAIHCNINLMSKELLQCSNDHSMGIVFLYKAIKNIFVYLITARSKANINNIACICMCYRKRYFNKKIKT